ncbi:heterokaryon incompatibility protein-domain-containing protein [Halenospora varia]|nr:heterokaryon incompatibility protein-domain-containing protein [Halenospora varia]
MNLISPLLIMTDRITYSWKLGSYFLTLPLYIFGFFGFRLSIGAWFRITKDCANEARQPSQDLSHDKVYRYSSLQQEEIRLLELQPGSYTGPLAGRFVNASLSNVAGQYEAVSYVWGSGSTWLLDGRPAPSPMISIDGLYLPLFPNLEKVLRSFRSETKTRTLWVDALCINQGDNDEKMHQIPLMTDIYARSKAVLAWLGEPTLDSLVGMEVVSYLAGDEPFSDNSPWNRLGPEDAQAGMRDILERDYFKRIWIVQEAALGRTVELFVGKTSVRWSAGQSARRLLLRIKLAELSPSWEEQLKDIDFRPLRELLEQSVSLSAREQGITETPTVLDVAHSMRHRTAGDKRDKIYGILGLVGTPEVARLVPDYTLSWQETYQRFYSLIEEQVLLNPSTRWEDILPRSSS